MPRLWSLLIALLGFTLLAAEPASAAWSSGQKVASGSAALVQILASESARLSAERAGKNVALSYEIASGSPVAARGTQSIQTAYRLEVQAASSEALAALNQVKNGATVYRSGTLGSSMAGESQYWSLLNPASPGYASLMGAPGGVPNFVLSGVLRPGASVITNEAAALGANAGRGIQVVTQPGGVGNLLFTMP